MKPNDLYKELEGLGFSKEFLKHINNMGESMNYKCDIYDVHYEVSGTQAVTDRVLH